MATGSVAVIGTDGEIRTLLRSRFTELPANSTIDCRVAE